MNMNIDTELKHELVNVYLLKEHDINSVAYLCAYLKGEYLGGEVYELVGSLSNVSLGMAFAYLNDEEGNGIRRSFSPGDVLEVSGKKYLCLCEGWKEVV